MVFPVGTPEKIQTILIQMNIDKYIALPDRLRQIAGRLVGEPRKELLKIAAELEQFPPELFKPSYAKKFKRRKARAERRRQAVDAPTPANGAGAEATNADRSNEERQEEAIADVSAAVAALSKSHNWESLGVRSRIKLLQTETLRTRGAKISTQTLYQPWIRGLW